ncbi:hypothetical protein TSUD_379290 [Trifolium subterraneum]|uniref:RNase H type-1 domain-containing protein n=1 Tax=Trifolium subterraneum TaxID=3900 RepID=A0A2Z6ND99_TRISU|nr:hypothetical protein TSUD_379290 [Trifolium subterraneum]
MAGANHEFVGENNPPNHQNQSDGVETSVTQEGGNARHSPRRESPGSRDERHRGPLSRRIMDIPLPRGLEKPSTLDKYDGTTDPDEHVQSVETALDYRNLRGSIKCKLFPLSLVRGASTWWRNLPPGSIDSWEELCRTFTAYFTTSRQHPKTVANLKAIIQGPEESLRSYIERERSSKKLLESSKYKPSTHSLNWPNDTSNGRISKRPPRSEGQEISKSVDLPRREKNAEEMRRKEKVEKSERLNHQKSQFTYHTPLNAPRDTILSEISSADFKSAGVRFPKQLPAKPNLDKKKFCRFHKSYGHVRYDCVHLKDEIKILIQKGYARQYMDGQQRTANNAPRQNQLAVDPASPEQHEKEAPDYLAAHLDGSWENFPGALVISGGGFNPITIGSIKRKFDELEKTSLVGEIKITEVKESSVPLAFYREEVPGGSPNFQIPLLVRAKMANFDFNMRFNPEKCTFGVKAGKFLSFYLTERGIEANPDKCRAFFDYPTPKSKKSIQTLNGMLTSMARFVAKSAQHALPLFKLLRKETTFEWTEECEKALQHLKRALSEPPVLTRPVEGEKLYLYLAVALEAISAVLIRENEQGQKSVYFVSRALQGPELRYLQIEKIALAVIMAARKLRYYFLAHSIVIRTDQPIKQLLARPDMVGRMLKWSLELAEFDISFERSGAGIILENGDGVLIEVSLRLSFPTTNNQAEYEAFLAGLRLAVDKGAEEIKIFTDSQLVASQVSGEYQTKEERLLEYLNLIKTKLAKFKETEVKHVPREHNARADVLSKHASTRRKKAGNQSLIQETLTKPSIEKAVDVMHVCAIDDQSWMDPVYNFLKTNTLPADTKETTKIRKRACSYVLLDDKLYRRGFSIPLLKCVEETRVEFILQEIHEGINGQHIDGRSMARKALRAGYYWPTMQNDDKDHVLKCDKCQRHGDMHIAPANELKTLISP